MHILPYNRTVKDLAGQTPGEFLAAVHARVPVRRGHATPRVKGEVAMYPGRTWYTLDLSGAAPPDGSRASTLDVALLQHHVLEPLAADRRRADRQAHRLRRRRAGNDGARAARSSGKAAVAFSMHPVTIDDLMSISDEGGIMPPKSTWFEPKLRDGLLVQSI